MHTSQATTSTLTTHASRSFKWKCGEVEMARGRTEAIREGNLADWSRQGLDASVAFEQVNIIVSTSIHALKALRSMVQQLMLQTEEILNHHCISPDEIDRIDLLLEQLDAIVGEASLGDVNLLGRSSGCMNIPYLIAEYQDAGDYHNFATMGVSISAVREDTVAHAGALVGIYVLTTDADRSVCWLNAPGFYLNTLKSEGFDSSESLDSLVAQELQIFREKLTQFDDQLTQTEGQFHQYKKMVGEVVTDLVVDE